jgi:uncharacterized membrane protein
MTPDRVSVNVGKLLGYVILSLADALLPPVFIVGIVFLAVLLELWKVLVPYVLALGGLAFVSALLAGVISVQRGGNRF